MPWRNAIFNAIQAIGAIAGVAAGSLILSCPWHT
jgi:hypothetical protein